MNLMSGNAVSIWVAELGIWPLVVVLVPNLMFRRYGEASGYKRLASLYQAIAVFVLTTVAGFIATRELTDLYFFIALALVAVGLYLMRAKVFPYRRTCVNCSAKLDFETIYFRDANLCGSCRAEKDAEEEAEETPPEPVETVESDSAWPGARSDEDGDGSSSDDPA